MHLLIESKIEKNYCGVVTKIVFFIYINSKANIMTEEEIILKLEELAKIKKAMIDKFNLVYAALIRKDERALKSQLQEMKNNKLSNI